MAAPSEILLSLLSIFSRIKKRRTCIENQIREPTTLDLERTVTKTLDSSSELLSSKTLDVVGLSLSKNWSWSNVGCFHRATAYSSQYFCMMVDRSLAPYPSNKWSLLKGNFTVNFVCGYSNKFFFLGLWTFWCISLRIFVFFYSWANWQHENKHQKPIYIGR